MPSHRRWRNIGTLGVYSWTETIAHVNCSDVAIVLQPVQLESVLISETVTEFILMVYLIHTLFINILRKTNQMQR